MEPSPVHPYRQLSGHSSPFGEKRGVQKFKQNFRCYPYSCVNSTCVPLSLTKVNYQLFYYLPYRAAK